MTAAPWLGIGRALDKDGTDIDMAGAP